MEILAPATMVARVGDLGGPVWRIREKSLKVEVNVSV